MRTDKPTVPGLPVTRPRMVAISSILFAAFAAVAGQQLQINEMRRQLDRLDKEVLADFQYLCIYKEDRGIPEHLRK